MNQGVAPQLWCSLKSFALMFSPLLNMTILNVEEKVDVDQQLSHLFGVQRWDEEGGRSERMESKRKEKEVRERRARKERGESKGAVNRDRNEPGQERGSVKRSGSGERRQTMFMIMIYSVSKR